MHRLEDGTASTKGSLAVYPAFHLLHFTGAFEVVLSLETKRGKMPMPTPCPGRLAVRCQPDERCMKVLPCTVQASQPMLPVAELSLDSCTTHDRRSHFIRYADETLADLHTEAGRFITQVVTIRPDGNCLLIWSIQPNWSSLGY